MSRKILILLLLLSLFCAIGIREMFEKADLNDRARQGIDNSEYRQEFFAPDMRKNKDFLSDECRIFLNKVEKDSLYFPIPSSTLDDSLTVSYENSWMAERSYKKTNMHEGTDIMASRNERGLYPIVSISDGTVTSLGWLELGGWRVGITSPQGVYYYYAHLESWRYSKGRYSESWTDPGIYGRFRIRKRGDIRQIRRTSASRHLLLGHRG